MTTESLNDADTFFNICWFLCLWCIFGTSSWRMNLGNFSSVLGIMADQGNSMHTSSKVKQIDFSSLHFQTKKKKNSKGIIGFYAPWITLGIQAHYCIDFCTIIIWFQSTVTLSIRIIDFNHSLIYYYCTYYHWILHDCLTKMMHLHCWYWWNNKIQAFNPWLLLWYVFHSHTI